MKELSLAYPARATLGEGLLWNREERRWWWTDIESATLSAWSPERGLAQLFHMPDRLGSFVFTRSGGVLLGLAKRLALAQPGEGGRLAIRTLIPVDASEPRTRINDGRTDRVGNYVFGTLNEAEEKRPIGSFFQYSPDHGLRRLALPTVAIANSICFSPDGGTMYFADTTARQIMQCDYDAAAATVSNVRLFAAPDIEQAWPDGSVVDRHGCLWNAEWGAASIARYAPDGRLLQRLHVPARNPTCPAIGGAGMAELMVATARMDTDLWDQTRYPDSGSLFRIDLGEALGLTDALFDDYKDNHET